MRIKAKNSTFFILILVLLNIISWLAVFELSRPSLLKVVFFDVGQGDAIFIEGPARYQILIDGGPGPVILEKLGEEMPFWDRNIDLVILSHPEYDHMAGLIEVLKRYKVENILWTGVLRDTAEFREWLKLIKDEGAEIRIAKSGKRVALGKSEKSGFIEILYPAEGLSERVFKDSNNTSIVAKVVFGENSFLFTGDIYKEVEGKIIENKTSLDSDILKVSHHGSKTSSGEEFVKKVSPEIAVISVGANNSYGHPHGEVLEILNKYGIKILRTDKDGDIKIFSNGKDYSYEPR